MAGVNLHHGKNDMRCGRRRGDGALQLPGLGMGASLEHRGWDGCPHDMEGAGAHPKATLYLYQHKTCILTRITASNACLS